MSGPLQGDPDATEEAELAARVERLAAEIARGLGSPLKRPLTVEMVPTSRSTASGL